MRELISTLLQAVDIEAGPRSSLESQPPTFKLRHPAVAYLSKLRSGRSEGRGKGSEGANALGPTKRQKTLHFMTGGLLGEVSQKQRPSGCGTIESSMVSETQRSLASLESMMSAPSRQMKGSQMHGLVMPYDGNTPQKDLVQSKFHDTIFRHPAAEFTGMGY